MKRDQRQYGGNNSREFWNRVNAILSAKTHGEIYRLGCELQNLEEHVLAKLKAAEARQKSGKRKAAR